MAIDCYFINGYWWPLVAIGGYSIVVINGYFFNGY